MLRRFPIKSAELRVIGKETERVWERAEGVSTLLTSLIRYGLSASNRENQLQEKLRNTPLNAMQGATGLSRHTLVRVRGGRPVHLRSLQLLKTVVRRVPVHKIAYCVIRFQLNHHSTLCAIAR